MQLTRNLKRSKKECSNIISIIFASVQGVWEHWGDGYEAAGGDEVVLDGHLVLHHPPRPHLRPHYDIRPGTAIYNTVCFLKTVSPATCVLWDR